jgi:hypothetical protein
MYGAQYFVVAETETESETEMQTLVFVQELKER